MIVTEQDASRSTSQQYSSSSSTPAVLVIDSTQLANFLIMEHSDQTALRQALNLSNQALNILQVLSRLTEDSWGHPEQRDKEQI